MTLSANGSWGRTYRRSTRVNCWEAALRSPIKRSTSRCGARNGPSLDDINQGMVGDCYFVSALGEVAMQDPAAIENMITENSNGSYAVEFQIDGRAEFVTVNNELPVYAGLNGATIFADGNGALSAPLIEKAYAELVEADAQVTPGSELGQNGDAYADIGGGWGQSLTEITGQSVNPYCCRASKSSTSLPSLLGTLAAAFSADEEVMMATSGAAASGISSPITCSWSRASTLKPEQ